MASPPTPHTVAIREILSDGKWHTRDEIIAKAGAKIPPGRALRNRERDAARLREAGQDGYRPPRSTDYYLAVGRRSIIVDTLNGLVGLEFKDENNKRWVRSTLPPTKEPHHQ